MQNTQLYVGIPYCIYIHIVYIYKYDNMYNKYKYAINIKYANTLYVTHIWGTTSYITMYSARICASYIMRYVHMNIYDTLFMYDKFKCEHQPTQQNRLKQIAIN